MHNFNSWNLHSATVTVKSTHIVNPFRM